MEGQDNILSLRGKKIEATQIMQNPLMPPIPEREPLDDVIGELIAEAKKVQEELGLLPQEARPFLSTHSSLEELNEAVASKLARIFHLRQKINFYLEEIDQVLPHD